MGRLDKLYKSDVLKRYFQETEKRHLSVGR